ncbi:MAG: hypothetical protein HC853_00385 [Anaerolineae bacterium]|nr:hypothetical protein [Anaerolineae bacterium]
MKAPALRDEFLNQFDSLYSPLHLIEHVADVDELVIHATLNERPVAFWLRTINRGTPNVIRLAAQAMDSDRAPQSLRNQVIDGQIIAGLIAPYLTDNCLAVCRELGIAGFDLSGNMVLDREDVYIERTGKSEIESDTKPLTNPFASKASRVARLLLMGQTTQKTSWTTRELAQKAGVSQALAIFSLKPMAEQEWVRIGRGNQGGVHLVDPGAILDAWRDRYTPDIVDAIRFFSVDSHDKAVKRLADHLVIAKIDHALTSFSGAATMSAVGNYGESSILVQAKPGEVRELAKSLKLTVASRGAIAVLCTDDEGLLLGSQIRKKYSVANPIQIYLDLYQDKRRGREQAAMFREAIIKF